METPLLLFNIISLTLPHHCVCVAEDKNLKMPDCDPLFSQGPVGHWSLRTKRTELGVVSEFGRHEYQRMNWCPGSASAWQLNFIHCKQGVYRSWGVGGEFRSECTLVPKVEAWKGFICVKRNFKNLLGRFFSGKKMVIEPVIWLWCTWHSSEGFLGIGRKDLLWHST